MKKVLFLITIVSLFFVTSNEAQEKRIALVIGNSNYESNPLRNPANDATLMETTLKALGFEVIKRINASRSQIEQSVQEFSDKLSNSKVALFYYAGHGIQSNGINYLIPVDAKLEKESDLKYQAVSVNFIVDEFEQYPENTNIVILDACRDNPLKTWLASRGGQRGFKAITPTSGTIIAFATSEGSTAADGTGANGLFTENLVKQMKQPGPIESVFKNTRREVEKLSSGKQSPQEWTKLKGDFYFVKGSETKQIQQEFSDVIKEQSVITKTEIVRLYENDFCNEKICKHYKNILNVEIIKCYIPKGADRDCINDGYFFTDPKSRNIKFGAWSNDQCKTSGNGWSVECGSCSTGKGSKRKKCEWVDVEIKYTVNQ